MNHKTEIIETKQVSDEAITVRIRCCGNPKTDSVLTICGMGKLNAEQLTADIDKHHDRVAAKCKAMGAGRHLLDAVLQKTKTHGAK